MSEHSPIEQLNTLEIEEWLEHLQSRKGLINKAALYPDVIKVFKEVLELRQEAKNLADAVWFSRGPKSRNRRHA